MAEMQVPGVSAGAPAGGVTDPPRGRSSALPPQEPTSPPAAGDTVRTQARTGDAPSAVELVGDPPPVATPNPKTSSPHPAGTVFGTYGYNRAAYSNSTVHMTGTGYDFTLHDVSARDKPSFGSPSAWAKGVLHTSPDIPQTNYQIGVFVTDRTAVSLSLDHMKYRMNHQNAAITGYVSPEANQQFAGTYTGQQVAVGTGGTILSDLQHCDGLNFLHAEVSHYVPLAQTRDGRFALEGYGSAGVGAMITDTRANVFSITASGEYDVTGMPPEQHNGFLSAGSLNDENHRHTHAGFVLDGAGVSAGAGVRATVFRYGFMEAGVKAGYSMLKGFHTHDEGRGAQNIGWAQTNLRVGVQVPLGRSMD